LKKETGKALKPEVIQKAMTRIEFTWDPIVSSLLKAAENAQKVGFLRKPDLQGIHDLGLLNEVLREKKLPEVEGPSLRKN
jgi:NitT/TauT family transport system substrate-binding protein